MRHARPRLEAVALRACAACFTLFWTNVILRRAAQALEWEPTWLLDRVPEFLLLFFSAVLFAIASLAAERRDQARSAAVSASASALASSSTSPPRS